MSHPQATIVKATGEREAFDPKKLLASLLSAGAQKNVAEDVVKHVERELRDDMTTHEIYQRAFHMLHTRAKPTAATYSLRRAIQELGPDGFPFEKYVAEIWRAQGYETLTDQIVPGECVEHEVDVVAWKKDRLIMVEAKFHHEYGFKSDVKVALYIKARFDDLRNSTFACDGKTCRLSEGWLVTNTKFSDMAIRYGNCQELNLLGWNYPKKGNLQDLIVEHDLFPLTVLASLTRSEKFSLLHNGLVLVKHVWEHRDALERLGVAKEKIQQVVDEASEVCRAHP